MREMKERLMKALRTLVAAGAVATAAACASSPAVDVRTEHLRACQAYTEVLEKAVVWVTLDKLGPAEVATLKEVNETTSPLCLTPEPSMGQVELIDQAAQALEDMLIARAMRESGGKK